MADGLRRRLLRWYRAERRDLPWRKDNDPYRVWISETMLQQTRVSAVVPYFERWMARFPDVRALASTAEEDVLSMWQGLGYYRRARDLLAAARAVSETGFPTKQRGWMALPGVGEYTAGAVASIAFGERVPAVDGNVRRVYSRVRGDAGLSLSASSRRWAASLADCETPGDVNQALMELGATVCRPVSPDCARCPVRRDCNAFAEGLQEVLPARRPRRETVRRRQTVTVSVFNGLFGVRKITHGDWWQGMWEFAPALDGVKRAKKLGTFTYAVTHHRVTVDASLKEVKRRSNGAEWRTWEELERLPLPSPQRKIARMAHKALQETGSNATGTASDPSSAKK